MAPNPAPMRCLVVRGNNVNLAYARRYELSLGDIKPSALHDCLLASEDKRFYRHSGLDYFSILRLLYDHFGRGQKLRGGSTISIQLMGEVILADRSREGLRAVLRKFEEIILANVAERHFPKDDLLLAYVNNVPVGHIGGRALVGLSAAAEALFGKRDPKALTLSEACTLTGMLNKPNEYLKAALRGDYRPIVLKRDITLENLRLSNSDRYSQEAIEQAKREEIRFFKNTHQLAEPRQIISCAYKQFPSKKPGLRVYLTIDKNIQRAAET